MKVGKLRCARGTERCMRTLNFFFFFAFCFIICTVVSVRGSVP